MGNINNYIEDNQKSFQESEFSNVDGAVLSALSYIEWEKLKDIDNETLSKIGGLHEKYDRDSLMQAIYGENGKSISLHDLAAILKAYEPYYNALSADQKSLIDGIAVSKRYGDIRFSNYEQHLDKKNAGMETGTKSDIEQFAGMTFTYSDGSKNPQNFVAFRGTDPHLEAWNEDFLMAYETETRSQERSVEYLNRVAAKLIGDIRLGGHSKGGNNANYAFLFCDEEVLKRIVKLYSYDGPGFHRELTYRGQRVDPGRKRRMAELLKDTAVCPFDSLIGLLLEENDFIFVDTDTGMVNDHTLFSWQLEEDGSFKIKKQSALSKYLNDLLDDVVQYLSYEERKVFIDTIWTWIYSLNLEDFDKFLEYMGTDGMEGLKQLIDMISGLEPDKRSLIYSSLAKILGAAFDEALQHWFPGYKNVHDRILVVLAEHKIHTWNDLWNYISADPLGHTLELLMQVISDPKAILGIMEMVAVTKLAGLVLSFVAGIIKCVIGSPFVHALALILLSFVVAKLVIDYLIAHWDEIMELLDKVVDFVTEVISKIVDGIMRAVHALIETTIFLLFEAIEAIWSGLNWLGDALTDCLKTMKDIMVSAVKTAYAIANPLLYMVCRGIFGLFQQPVTVDLPRLYDAVDQMDRLAGKVEQIDNRLNRLYTTLLQESIEVEENIFVSIFNMYNLTAADVKVDDGYRIRKKANAIRNTFQKYKDNEDWVKSQLSSSW